MPYVFPMCDAWHLDSLSSADETPTEFDAILAELEAALDALLDALGPTLGLTDEQIQAIEADNANLIKDIEAIEHGEIDVDGGLEAILQDIINILHDFGIQATEVKSNVEATSKQNNMMSIIVSVSFS